MSNLRQEFRIEKGVGLEHIQEMKKLNVRPTKLQKVYQGIRYPLEKITCRACIVSERVEGQVITQSRRGRRP